MAECARSTAAVSMRLRDGVEQVPVALLNRDRQFLLGAPAPPAPAPCPADGRPDRPNRSGCLSACSARRRNILLRMSPLRASSAATNTTLFRNIRSAGTLRALPRVDALESVRERHPRWRRS